MPAASGTDRPAEQVRRWIGVVWLVTASLSLIRLPFARLGLANYLPLFATSLAAAAIAVVGWWVAAHASRTGRTSRLIAAHGGAAAVCGLVALEGLRLLPRFMRVGLWSGLVIALGVLAIVLAATVALLDRHRIRLVVAVAAVGAMVALVGPAVRTNRFAWLFVATAGTLVLLVIEVLVKLLDTQLRLMAAHRRQAELHHQLVVASAEILEGRQRESLALMAAGIAHEINNPLTHLNGNLELLQELIASQMQRSQLPRPPVAASGAPGMVDLPGIAAAVQPLKAGLDSLHAVVSRIRSTFRGTAASPEAVDVRQAIVTLLRTLPPEYRGRVRVETDVPAKTVVHTQPANLFIIVMNLVKNAIDATLSVSDPRVIVSATTLPDGVRIDVVDNGHGIDPTQVERCFDPFYTTKAERSGMGVGLAICRLIANRTGGSVELHANPDHGMRATYSIINHKEQPQ